MAKDVKKKESEVKVPTWLDKAAKEDEQKKQEREAKKNQIKTRIEIPQCMPHVSTPLPTGMEMKDDMKIPSMIHVSPKALAQLRQTQQPRVEITTRDPTSILEEIARNKGCINLRGFPKPNADRCTLDIIELSEVLGKGGFGIVVKGKGYDTITSDYAVKVLYPQPTAEKEALTRELFKREMAGGRELAHDSFARLIKGGIIEETGTLGLVSEYVKGETLYKKNSKWVSAGKRINPLMAGLIFWRWLNGIASMNKQGYAHRDHKGENIMIQDSGATIKILDLGGVKGINQKTGEAELDIEFGTVTHQHPSIFNADSGKIFNYGSLDFHAACVEMYNIATGRMPWGKEIINWYDIDGNPRPDAPVAAEGFSQERYQMTKKSLMEKTTLVPPHIINRHVPKIFSDTIMLGLRERLEDIPLARDVVDNLQKKWIHSPWFGGLGAQNKTLEAYLSIFDPQNEYNPNQSVKGNGVLEPLALANLYNRAVSLHQQEVRRTLTLPKGSQTEVEIHRIETDPRFKDDIDYSLAALDTTFASCTGELAARTLCPLFGIPIKYDFRQNWDVYYEVLREEEFEPKARDAFGATASKALIVRAADRAIEEMFWKCYPLYTPKTQNGANRK